VLISGVTGYIFGTTCTTIEGTIQAGIHMTHTHTSLHTYTYQPTYIHIPAYIHTHTSLYTYTYQRLQYIVEAIWKGLNEVGVPHDNKIRYQPAFHTGEALLNGG
jgi:hypothetical protein